MRNHLLFAVLGLILAATSAVAGPMDAKTIVVAGFAQQSVRPDFATVRIGVINTDKSSTVALDTNNALMRKVLDAIKAEGIPAPAIQTTDFVIRAVHPARHGENAYGDDETVTTGYSVVNTFTVTITDLKKIGKVIDSATRAGANMSGAVNFEVTDRRGLEAKLLAEAVRDARHNAEIMATAENARVGKLIAVSNTAPIEPRWTERGPDAVVVTGSRLESVVITEGVVPVSAQVMAIYALE
jgi:uncharacterized protein YggE